MARNFTEGYKGKGYQKRKSRIFQRTWRSDLEEIFKEQLGIIKKFESDDEYEDDILRMKISLLMSLYDYIIHEIIKYRLLELSNLEKNELGNEPKNYIKFKISIKTMKQVLDNTSNAEWLLSKDIEYQNNILSFINIKKTTEGLSLITDSDLFVEYCKINKLDYEDFKENFDKLTRRRNDIVHKLDIKNKRTIEKNPITENEVIVGIEFIRDIILYILKNI